MKIFPKPLTAEEERAFLERYRNGDPEAKRILIERNLRLVAHVAKKYQSCEEDPEDLISIGTIGLIKAVATFDSAKNSRLGTYAAKCIDKAILPCRIFSGAGVKNPAVSYGASNLQRSKSSGNN